MSDASRSGDLAAQPVMLAADVLAHRWRRGSRPDGPAPEAVLICLQSGLTRYLARRHRGKRVDGFMGELFLLRGGAGRVAALGNFGVGAPVVAALVEELAAYGVRRFVSLGLAAGLQPDLTAGAVVVCDGAIPDEGTSRHYLAPEGRVDANPNLVAQLSQALARRDIAYSIGSSWTTDAPYREMRPDAARHQNEGVRTVDMEAAALFAVGRYLGLETAALFVVSDSLADQRWRPAADGRTVQRGLQTVADVAFEVLARKE